MKVSISACPFCRKWGTRCLPKHPLCFKRNNWITEPYLTASAPKDKSRIIKRVWNRSGFVIRRLGCWLVKPLEHPWHKTKKKFLRNKARQKHKERVYYR